MGIVHLVNQEAVILESVSLTCGALVKRLDVTPNEVTVDIRLVGDKIQPQFNVGAEVLDRMSDADVRQIMAEVWLSVRGQMVTRLERLTDRRHE